MANSIRARRLLEASETGSCELFVEMKKINRKGRGSGDLPDSVGGVSREAQANGQQWHIWPKASIEELISAPGASAVIPTFINAVHKCGSCY